MALKMRLTIVKDFQTLWSKAEVHGQRPFSETVTSLCYIRILVFFYFYGVSKFVMISLGGNNKKM